MGRSAPIAGSAVPQWPLVGVRPTPYMTHPVAGLAHVLVPATAAPSEAHGGRGAFVIHGVGRPWALCVEHKWPRTMYPHQSGPPGQAAAGPQGGAACLAQTHGFSSIPQQVGLPASKGRQLRTLLVCGLSSPLGLLVQAPSGAQPDHQRCLESNCGAEIMRPAFSPLDHSVPCL